MSNLPRALVSTLQGTPWGSIFPDRPNPPPPSRDGRTAALYVLREYICALDFYRYMGPAAPAKMFNITPDHFYIEQPDYTADFVEPSISIVGDRADYDVIGLVSYIEEDTVDVYGKGTVLQWMAEYVETINLEINVAKKSERRAVLAAMEVAFSPTEQMSGVRFMMPDYYNELVCFSMQRRELINDETDSGKNRRKAQLEIEMRFNIVRLINIVQMKPSVKVNADVDENTNIPIDLTRVPGARLGVDLGKLAAIQNYESRSVPSNIFDSPQTTYQGGGGNGFTNDANK